MLFKSLLKKVSKLRISATITIIKTLTILALVVITIPHTLDLIFGIECRKTCLAFVVRLVARNHQTYVLIKNKGFF